MTNRKGFTIFEMIMSMVLVGLLVVGIMFAYLTCFRAFDSGQDRITIRTKLSQAMDLMSRELYNAQSITSCTQTSLTFNANLGGTLAAYTFALSGSNLMTDGGVTRATGVQTPGFNINKIFICTNGLVTIDMTAVQNGESVRLQNNIRPRNMPMGLAGWWQFDEATSGTCSGAAAIDSSGNGSTGTCVNSPTWTTGAIASDPINGAMGFNSSSSQYVSLGTFTGQGTYNRSYSAWFNITSLTPSKQRILSFPADDSGNDTPAVAIAVTQVGVGGPPYSGYISISPAINTWQHVVVTVNGNTVTCYLNGVLVGTANDSGSVVAANPIGYIGRYNASWGEYINGSVDDVRIYNRVLSASEVSQLYNAGIGN